MARWFYLASCCWSLAVAACGQEPLQASACELQTNPDAFERQLVELTAFVSHGFEDFTLFDPDCPEWPRAWVIGSRSRWYALKVEGISIPLVRDRKLKEFHRVVERAGHSLVRATLRGRFFARRQSGSKLLRGCCNLFVIQQVMAVDPQVRADVDYGGTIDYFPQSRTPGCSYQNLMPPQIPIQYQREADRLNQGPPSADPRAAASRSLARYLQLDASDITELKEIRNAAGRVVYEWKPEGAREPHVVVTSRPHWLSFYARDPAQADWITLAVFAPSCK